LVGGKETCKEAMEAEVDKGVVGWEIEEVMGDLEG